MTEAVEFKGNYSAKLQSTHVFVTCEFYAGLGHGESQWRWGFPAPRMLIALFSLAIVTMVPFLHPSSPEAAEPQTSSSSSVQMTSG